MPFLLYHSSFFPPIWNIPSYLVNWAKRSQQDWDYSWVCNNPYKSLDRDPMWDPDPLPLHCMWNSQIFIKKHTLIWKRGKILPQKALKNRSESPLPPSGKSASQKIKEQRSSNFQKFSKKIQNFGKIWRTRPEQPLSTSDRATTHQHRKISKNPKNWAKKNSTLNLSWKRLLADDSRCLKFDTNFDAKILFIHVRRLVVDHSQYHTPLKRWKNIFKKTYSKKNSSIH